MQTINDLRQQAATIKNATQVGENTATRVGTTFETIADLLEGMGGVTNLSTIDIGSIDTLNTTGDMLVGTPNIYTLTKTIGANTFKVGTLFQFANNGRYDVAQVIVSQFIVDSDGRIDTTSADQEVHIFYRLCKTMNGGSLPTPIGTWTTWTELGGSGGSGVTIDPYPTQNSGNAVSSGGVFERLQDIAPKVDISAIDDIDEYTDMLAGVSPFYEVTKTISSNTFRIGTLMEFANQGRYILYQILATDYVLNDDGTLDTTLSENGGLKLIWRMKQFSGNPPAGVTIGVWSAWSYLSGGGAQPDNEDIDLNANDQLQFANKAYDASAFSGLGRVYLRKNIVTLEGTGKNVLTQAMVNTANTIYHIQYDYDLNGQTITLPAGCVLEFEGGSLANGTIVGNSTTINAAIVKIFNNNVTLDGKWNIEKAYPEWYGAIGDGITDDSLAINKTININTSSQLSVSLSCKTYLISPDVIVFTRDNVCLNGNNAKVISRSNSDYSHLVYADKERNGITIEGITFDNTGDEFEMPTIPISNHTVLSINGNNACVRNCDVYFYGVHGIAIYTPTGRNACVENNNLFFSRKGTNSYDCSAIYVEAVDIIISKNHIYGKFNSDSPSVIGGIEAHSDVYIVTDNIVENCRDGINLVNHQSDINNLVPTDGTEGKSVCDNIISKVSRGIVIWSDSNSNPVENLRIANNVIKLIPAGTFGIGTNYAINGKINKLWITGNTITGDASAEQYPNHWDVMGLICFCCGEVNGLTIKDNTISNSMHAGIYIGTTTENAFVRDIDICDNNFIDCSCYALQYQNGDFPYYSHDVIYCKVFNNLSIRNNNIIYNESVNLVDYLVNLDEDYDFAEVIGNNALCLHDTSKEGVKEEIGTCHFDYSKVKTDMTAYLDFLPAENRVYQNKVVTPTSTSLSIPSGIYRQGDKVIFPNNICFLFKDSYSTLGMLTSGDLSATYKKKFFPYASGLSYFHVGMPISIPNAIGGASVKHTVVKKASNYIAFSEDVPISSSASGAGSVQGYKSFVPKMAIGALASLPTLTSEDAGFNCFHTTSGKPVWWNGSAWVDATGATV